MQLKIYTQKFILPAFWFLVGFTLTGILLASFILFYFQYYYQGKIYPGVFIGKTYAGGKSPEEVRVLYEKQNDVIKSNVFLFTHDEKIATVSAEELNLGYNAELLSEQAYLIGRSEGSFTNFYLIISSYVHGVSLVTSYSYNPISLREKLDFIQNEVYQEPIDALFTVEDNRVVAFRQSKDGTTIDFDKLDDSIQKEVSELVKAQKSNTVRLEIPIKVSHPAIATDKVNNFGIVETIGEGVSTFYGSIPNRIFNISLATSRINGVLVAPNETFSFNKALGDVSKFTGYKEAYVIQSGKTVLGDGGGVCQVSTTLFRAILNTGLPLVERHAHAYRVGYYEQNSPPGLDATIFTPTVDLRFKNDTGRHILIQGVVDKENLTLTFLLFGTKDNREVTLTKPVITSQTAPPPPVTQDDPNLPRGQVRQVEHEAWGARVVFERIVKKDGKELYKDTFASNYRPWGAVFMKGTKD